MALNYPLPFLGDPPLGNRFLVVFFHFPRALRHFGSVPKHIGVPNPIDVLFRSVTGIGSTIEMETVEEGGQNLYTHNIPKRISHSNLVLERGLVVPSPLTIGFEQAMSEFRVRPYNVLVTVLNGSNLPVAAYLFLKAMPVKWQMSDFNAEDENVIVETLELVYQHRLTMSNIPALIP